MARVLVADDNELSLEFFVESIAPLGHVVDKAVDGLQACQLALMHGYDLMLIDSLMPQRNGVDTLHAIRGGIGPSCVSTAIATSADAGIDRESLKEAGFSAVIIKPCRIEDLRKVLESHLPGEASSKQQLDDGSALEKIGGDHAILAKLRNLLALELDALPAEISACAVNRNWPALLDRLHMLDASAGFCGASQLASAAQRLRRDIQANSAWPARSIGEFLRACAETRVLLG
ncbi:response regulator [Dokdonella sp.]|uniref:response regulator n=1 Tax=Dokdonella sp. TaxID=2291710 RepID=UPI003C49BBCB